MKQGLRCGLLALVLCWQAAQGAGLSNHATAASPTFSPDKIIQLAKQVEKLLAGKGARVAIIGRIGRPASEMPDGMRYTHAAFAVYSEITTVDGRRLAGYATFNEYQGEKEPDTSTLVQDYPVDFYASVAELEAGVIIPSAKLQRRLLAVITSPTYQSLHEPHYSAIANPYTLGRQNCTEFVLDVIHAAIYQTSDISVIKANTRAFFVAQPVNVNR